MLLQGTKRDSAVLLQMLPALIMKEIVADNDTEVILLTTSCIEFGIGHTLCFPEAAGEH